MGGSFQMEWVAGFPWNRWQDCSGIRILAACEQPGASVAGVALANGLNANMVHKWRRIAKAKSEEISAPASSDFIPVPVTVPDQRRSDGESVMLEVRQIKVHWPLAHIDRAIDWLRLLQS
jgi:transposase